MAFQYFTKTQVKAFTQSRDGETKIGQSIETLKAVKSKTKKIDWAEYKQQYVLIGIEEDIGVRANFGREGTNKAFQSFLNTFLNQQDNQFIDTENILLAGYFMFEATGKPVTLRKAVAKNDIVIAEFLADIHQAGKTPIVIGGGHNNSYPNIKAASEAFEKPLGVINFDAHTDFRLTEGRHSGNGFSYAYEEKFLGEYLVIGIQEAYTGQAIFDTFNDNRVLNYISYEDVFLRNTKNIMKGIESFVKYIDTKKMPLGLEIDLDVIPFFPSSAMSPEGLDIRTIQNAVKKVIQSKSAKYLHICEGAPELHPEGHRIVGRTIARMVKTFVEFN